MDVPNHNDHEFERYPYRNREQSLILALGEGQHHDADHFYPNGASNFDQNILSDETDKIILDHGTGTFK